MGASSARDMAEMVNEGFINEDVALEWHLFSNHFPSLPRGVLALAKEALANAAEREWDKTIDISSVGRHRVYGTEVPTAVCIKEWHLQPFLTWEVEEVE